MPNEADTCRTDVVSRLQAAGWDDEPHSIAEQRTITDGRIVPIGKGFIRRAPKRVDFVEAKAAYRSAFDGLQQAKQYAEMLVLKFAYATNGKEIVEFDYFTGVESGQASYPAPAALWERYRTGAPADRLLTPFNHDVRQGERYYQQIAINRTVEAILRGQRRVLLTMATGTGKTAVAFQIWWKLWNARWNRTGDHRRPRILYLADRNILIDQPKDGIFAAFGDARCKIESGEVVKSREMYFAIYQALAEDERREGIFKAFPQDFFDLVIVDECHRGSAREDSAWRAILQYFEPAYQLGMTATPLRDDTRDSYAYFGNPLYTYSLRQGIEDGFLAPYRVHRVITEWDAAGWRPNQEDRDRYGREIPYEEYSTQDFERVVALRARTDAIARHLTAFLKMSSPSEERTCGRSRRRRTGITTRPSRPSGSRDATRRSGSTPASLTPQGRARALAQRHKQHRHRQHASLPSPSMSMRTPLTLVGRKAREVGSIREDDRLRRRSGARKRDARGTQQSERRSRCSTSELRVSRDHRRRRHRTNDHA